MKGLNFSSSRQHALSQHNQNLSFKSTCFDLLWLALTFFDLLWLALTYFDLFWLTLTCFDLLWLILTYFDLLWLALTYFDLLWLQTRDDAMIQLDGSGTHIITHGNEALRIDIRDSLLECVSQFWARDNVRDSCWVKVGLWPNFHLWKLTWPTLTLAGYVRANWYDSFRHSHIVWRSNEHYRLFVAFYRQDPIIWWSHVFIKRARDGHRKDNVETKFYFGTHREINSTTGTYCAITCVWIVAF